MLKRLIPKGSAFKDMGLRLLACWDHRFESHQGMGVWLSWVLCIVR